MGYAYSLFRGRTAQLRSQQAHACLVFGSKRYLALTAHNSLKLVV
jgi:hypothetical protein